LRGAVFRRWGGVILIILTYFIFHPVQQAVHPSRGEFSSNPPPALRATSSLPTAGRQRRTKKTIPQFSIPTHTLIN